MKNEEFASAIRDNPFHPFHPLFRKSIRFILSVATLGESGKPVTWSVTTIRYKL